MCAVREDVHAKEVKQKHLVEALAAVRPRITSQMLQFYDQFRRSCHIESI